MHKDSARGRMGRELGSALGTTEAEAVLPPTALLWVLRLCNVQCNAAPFNDHDPSSRSAKGSKSSNSDGDADGFPAPASSPSSREPESRATTARALSPSAAQHLEQQLLELLPQPPVSTPLTPMLSVMLPVLQPNLPALPPTALLWVMRLCNAAGTSHAPGAAWLQGWAAALHTQLPKLTSEAACWMLAEVLSLRQAQLPEGLLDDLFVGVLKEPCSCSGSSLAAVLMAVAATELAQTNSSSSTSRTAHQQSPRGSSAGNVTLASWRSGFYSAWGGSSGRSQPGVSTVSQLHPLALHCCVEELGQGDRLAQLRPAELAGVAAAAAALQLRLPAGWLDRLFSALEQRLPQLSGPALALLTASLPQLLPAGGNLRLWRQLGGVVQAHGASLSAEQLCEVLPLVQAADLPLPVEWLTSCMHKIEGSTQMPQHATGLLCSPAMVPVMVAAVLAALYGGLVGANATTTAAGNGARAEGSGAGTAAAAAASSSGSPADDAVGSSPLVLDALQPLAAVQQASQPPPPPQQQQQTASGSTTDQMSAAAWGYLSAREACLQAGQPLLPPLQQQLCESLGCCSRGFLWVAAAWTGQSPQGLIHDLPVEVFLQIALQVHFMVEAARSAAAAPPTAAASNKDPMEPQVLQQLQLMPAAMLRLALHEQLQQQLPSPSTGAGPPRWEPMLGVRLGMESLMLWERLSEYGLGQQQGEKAVGQVPEGLLHEVLQLLVQLLDSTLHQAQPGASGSSGSKAGPSHAWLFPDDSVFDCSTPAVRAATLAGYIGHLTPNVTAALAAAAASGAAAAPSSSAGSSSSSSSSSSLACNWVPLLLRAAAALQHSIRFEAQQGPSQPHMDHRWQPLYRDMPQGPPWFAAFCLLSTALHKSVNLYMPSPHGPPNALQDWSQPKKPGSNSGGQHSLLRWLLDNVPPEQQGAVQQQVLGLLLTALKLSGKPRSYSEISIVAEFHKGVLEVLWTVLQQLQDSTPSSNSSRCAEGPSAAAAASTGSSSTSAQGACLPWLSLLGRVFLQAAQVMTATRGCVRGLLSAQRVTGADKEELVSAVINAMRLADGVLPPSISHTAALFASADTFRQLPANGSHQGVMQQQGADQPAQLTGQSRRELQGLGEQVGRYCSSAGICCLSKVQDSSCALVDAQAGVAAFLSQSISSFGTTSMTSFPSNAPVSSDEQAVVLGEWGIPASLADKTAQSCFKGQACDMQDLLLTAFVVHPALSTYLNQLEGLGLALSGFPVGRACSNPRCVTLVGSSEDEGVGGATCRCSGCRLVFYCNREVCQKSHWGVHKAVCKGVQAAAAAAVVGKVAASV